MEIIKRFIVAVNEKIENKEKMAISIETDGILLNITDVPAFCNVFQDSVEIVCYNGTDLTIEYAETKAEYDDFEETYIFHEENGVILVIG